MSCMCLSRSPFPLYLSCLWDFSFDLVICYLKCGCISDVSAYSLTFVSLPGLVEKHGCFGLPRDSEEDSGISYSFGDSLFLEPQHGQLNDGGLASFWHSFLCIVFMWRRFMHTFFKTKQPFLYRLWILLSNDVVHVVQ